MSSPDPVPSSLAPPPPPAAENAKTIFTANDCVKRFERYIKFEKPRLDVFYKPGEEKLQECSRKAEVMIQELLKMDGCTPEIARNLSALVLYNVVMLLDDSSSMEEEEAGERINTLQKTMEAITDVYDHANNTGTVLDRKIIKRFVFKSPMEKPLLIMIITDGGIEGEKEELLRTVINTCVQKCKDDPTRGEDAVAFHFSRVGNDDGAEKLLRDLDVRGGKHVDCLPVEKKLEHIDGVQKWIVLHKLLLGALMEDVNDDDKEHVVDGNVGDMAAKSEDDDEYEDDYELPAVAATS
ncbi:uncharacterized protein H6S33_007063 [Morchella sextelata]|uniref:uncharacterized protein n=1 Tax=Morchella sextelata TaxID=1174677 RepID=UPI001D05B63C|nr:uncharacterized protein H6S33_007063 [Morchella sextelata]KAH0604032.1 hypothetical protein H6S33_007063 [Morchella sextelata]